MAILNFALANYGARLAIITSGLFFPLKLDEWVGRPRVTPYYVQRTCATASALRVGPRRPEITLNSGHLGGWH
jgi:hypothetical protein